MALERARKRAVIERRSRGSRVPHDGRAPRDAKNEDLAATQLGRSEGERGTGGSGGAQVPGWLSLPQTCWVVADEPFGIIMFHNRGQVIWVVAADSAIQLVKCDQTSILVTFIMGRSEEARLLLPKQSALYSGELDERIDPTEARSR